MRPAQDEKGRLEASLPYEYRCNNHMENASQPNLVGYKYIYHGVPGWLSR